MNKIFLIFATIILSMSCITESRAECNNGVDGNNNPCGTCGESCDWVFDSNGKLFISGSGTMDDFSWDRVNKRPDTPWINYISDIKQIEFAEDSTITNIGHNAFYNAQNLTDVSLPNITNIGDSAFAGAGSLKNIDLSNIINVGESAFYNAASLTSAYMPNVINIGNEAFEGASSLESAYIPKVKEIVNDAFRETGLKSIYMPNVEHIEDEAFENSRNLSLVEIPDSLKSTYSEAFNTGNDLILIIPDTLDTSGWDEETFSDSFADDKKITFLCKGNQSICENNMKKFIKGDEEGYCNSNAYGCIDASAVTFDTATKAQCTGTNYYWSGESCNNRNDGLDCSGGYAKLNNNCVDPLETFAKKRWTPAEAAQWLHDGNDNFVIITFKK